jgi:hypothetical protein
VCTELQRATAVDREVAAALSRQDDRERYGGNQGTMRPCTGDHFDSNVERKNETKWIWKARQIRGGFKRNLQPPWHDWERARERSGWLVDCRYGTQYYSMVVRWYYRFFFHFFYGWNSILLDVYYLEKKFFLPPLTLCHPYTTHTILHFW